MRYTLINPGRGWSGVWNNKYRDIEQRSLPTGIEVMIN